MKFDNSMVGDEGEMRINEHRVNPNEVSGENHECFSMVGDEGFEPSTPCL